METVMLPPTPEHIQFAAELLQQGEIIAFPTETVYGLGANIFNNQAIQKIFEAKERPADNPLIAHISGINQVHLICQNIPQNFYRLANFFFPGPLSIIIPKKDTVPLSVTAGNSVIAVRMPDNTIAKKLIEALGFPIVAPSANRSGRPSSTRAQHVFEDLQGRIPLIIDGGPCKIGIESTVVDITVNPPVILRPGHITKEQLEKVVGPVAELSSQNLNEETPKAPGMKYRHYAPETPIILAQDLSDLVKISHLFKDKRVLLLTNSASVPPMVCKVDTASLNEHTLFEHFRNADKKKYDRIVILPDDQTRANKGLMNRIEKARKR